MSGITEYVKSDKQEDWIAYIVEDLRGTCNKSVHEYIDEYLEQGFDEMALYVGIDDAIFECEECGWWYGVDEMADYEDERICQKCFDAR